MSDTSPLQIAIVGAGLGGLTLAQGLRKAGLKVAVYERDRVRTDRLQGYRIHLSPKASRALAACLPDHVYEAFLATTGRPNRCLSFFDHRLASLLTLDGREIGIDGADPIDSYKSVSRTSFRDVLMTGLDDALHFDKHCAGYTQQTDGPVTLNFTDGSHAVCDLLVGSDGTRSQVRAQLLPGHDLVDTGCTVIAGKAPLNEHTRGLLPWQFFEGGSMIFAPGEIAGFAAVHEFPPRVRADTPSATSAATAEDYIMWNLLGTTAAVGSYDELSKLDPEQLENHAVTVARTWSPDFIQLMRLSNPDTITVLRLRTSTRPQPWRNDQVTLLGDAIHAMPPTAGVGAVSAIIDAACLTRLISQAVSAQKSLGQALDEYQREMLDRSFAKVKASNRNLNQAVTGNPVALAISKTAFRSIARIGPARRGMTRAIYT